MENKNNKNKNSKNFLTNVLIGLVAVCVVMLLTEVYSNTAADIKAIQSFESHSIAVDEPVIGE